MHVEEERIPELVSVMGCRRDTFPQIYLRLPLSNEKLRLTAFAPIISLTDKYLAGWKASLLNMQARSVLVNAVLDSLPTYLMMALQLLPSVIETPDSRRRAFLWSGEEKCHGSACLIAWEQVTKPKRYGGLRIKDLNIQNKCLLLKLLHRLHSPEESSWASWVLAHADIISMEGPLSCDHWDSLRHLASAYRDLTAVTIGNGETTSLWHDAWNDSGRFSELFPVLFSHTLKPECLFTLPCATVCALK